MTTKKQEVNTRLAVHDLNGKVVDNIQLDKKLFDGTVNEALLYEVKRMYEANARQGNASTKTRSDVRGGGTKPWRQKGTGRARVGSSRNPLWTHGGVAFGPHPRDFRYSMPKKAVRAALLSSLNARLAEETLKAIVKIEMEGPKTKDARDILDALKAEGRILIVVNGATDAVKLSFRNLAKADLKEASDINARDVLLSDSVIVEKEALEKLAERLK